MIKTDTTTNTILRLSDKLRSAKKIYFVRAGDGELGIATNNHGSKFQEYTRELSYELRESLLIEDENYLLGLMAGYENEPSMTSGFFAQSRSDNMKWSNWLLNDIKISPRLFYNQSAFAFLAVRQPDIIKSFINEFVRNKRIMFVGQVAQDKAEQLFGPINYYVNTPFRNAYESIDEIYETIGNGIDDCEVILSACGPTTNVIAKRLWNDDKHVHFLDIGSLIGLVDLDNSTHGWMRFVDKNFNLYT